MRIPVRELRRTLSDVTVEELSKALIARELLISRGPTWFSNRSRNQRKAIELFDHIERFRENRAFVEQRQ